MGLKLESRRIDIFIHLELYFLYFTVFSATGKPTYIKTETVTAVNILAGYVYPKCEFYAHSPFTSSQTCIPTAMAARAGDHVFGGTHYNDCNKHVMTD